MRDLVHLVGLDGNRLSVDSNSITAILEMRDTIASDERGNTYKMPEHTLIIMGSIQLKIKSNYDQTIESIKEQEYNNNLGID